VIRALCRGRGVLTLELTEWVGMGKTYLHAVASRDGYIADERDDGCPVPARGAGPSVGDTTGRRWLTPKPGRVSTRS
jgi:hypothetical protein